MDGCNQEQPRNESLHHLKYSTSSVPDEESALKFARTVAPERATQVLAASGIPTEDVGVVVPSVVYLTVAVLAQTAA